MSRAWSSALVLVSLVSLSSPALAGPGRTQAIAMPREAFNSALPADVSNVLYLNRCRGGCMVTGGQMNDARQHTAAFVEAGQYILGEYQNNDGETGTAADAEWAELVQCIREIYSPFDIVVVENEPTTGNWTEAMIGGLSGDIGFPAATGGVAPATCAPIDNSISFTFANQPYYFYPGNARLRVLELCAVAGQESAHQYGVDHSFEYFDGTSACNDPMTYRSDCGGQRFFRNKAAKCGEFVQEGPRECRCGGGLQNTHQKLLSEFGAGTNALIPPPTAAITSPANNGTASNGQVVTFSAGSKRGVERSELYLNGYLWATVPGAAYGANGQPNPSTYNALFPAGVPDGVIDMHVIAYDDLGASSQSATVRVTKGAPCTAAASCAEGQQCDGEGRCYWEPPIGALGDACGYNQYCESNLCVETTEGSYCSQECIVGAADSCPMDFECIATGPLGACIPSGDGGGCCSAGGAGSLWGHGALSLCALALVLGRRRRRR